MPTERSYKKYGSYLCPSQVTKGQDGKGPYQGTTTNNILVLFM
jgi:hypothetical protein